MSKTHWKKYFNPNYLGSYSLDPGEEKTLTITEVKKENVTNPDGKEEALAVCYFQEEKPLILNKTNSESIAKVAGSPYVEDWAGAQIQIYTARVKAFGQVVDAIRVRDSKPKPKRKLNENQFKRMLLAIEKGDLDPEDARKNYDLTEKQLKKI